MSKRERDDNNNKNNQDNNEFHPPTVLVIARALFKFLTFDHLGGSQKFGGCQNRWWHFESCQRREPLQSAKNLLGTAKYVICSTEAKFWQKNVIIYGNFGFWQVLARKLPPLGHL
jgi:hypothetical protein